MFGRATIRLGIGPHSSYTLFHLFNNWILVFRLILSCIGGENCLWHLQFHCSTTAVLSLTRQKYAAITNCVFISHEISFCVAEIRFIFVKIVSFYGSVVNTVDS